MVSIVFPILTKWYTDLFRRLTKEPIDLRDLRDPQQLGLTIQRLRELHPDLTVTQIADMIDADESILESVRDLPLNGNERN